MGLLGDYRVRCLYSKAWTLREALLTKVSLMLDELASSPGLSSCLPQLCNVVKIGVEDKIQQVFFSALTLMDDLLGAATRCDPCADARTSVSAHPRVFLEEV